MGKLKFSKGDSVIVNDNRPKYEGKTGKIYSIQPAQWVGDKTTYNVKLSYGEIVPFKSNELDSYEAPKVKLSTKFNVGNRVKIIGCNKYYDDHTGTITEIIYPKKITDKVRYYVEFEDCDYDGDFFGKEMISEEEYQSLVDVGQTVKDQMSKIPDSSSKSKPDTSDWNEYAKRTSDEWNKFVTEK